MKYDDLINFRWGSEPQAKIKRNGLSRKWMFIKPDVGNLSAACQTPFNSFNVIPYFGGYPNGFSTYEYCAWATPKKIDNDKLVGFTHFSFSGPGDLGHFHNYFLIKPCDEKQKIESEKYSLNGFSIKTSKYEINVEINKRIVKYDIKSNEEIVIIPGYDGLLTEKYKNEIIKVKIENNSDYISIDSDYPWLHLYWAIKIIKGKIIDVCDDKIILSKECKFLLSYSKDSIDDAASLLDTFKSKESLKEWESLFNVFKINGNKEYLKLFYTSLMFALKKPFIYSDDSIYDFATMWDIYKTLLPLIFLLYKKEATIITNNMLKLVDKNGVFYHTNLFSKQGPLLSDQAICLINISLSTAALYGVNFDKKLAMKLQKNEINYYLKNVDKFERTTYVLDLADAIIAYYNAYGIDLGIKQIQESLNKVFDNDKVYLDKKAVYYEGNYSNYSFRTSCSTIYRISNKKKLNKALDKFFGFKGFDSKRFSKPTSPLIVKKYMKKCKRFEGLNNEPDMETMYLYSYLNEYKKQNTVIKDVINNSFSLENKGVPGNDDNGGLSSWLVFNLIGIFPIVGTNIFKIGLPFFDEITVKNLKIIRHKENENSININKVIYNEKQLEKFEISAKEISDGGILEIYLN